MCLWEVRSKVMLRLGLDKVFSAIQTRTIGPRSPHKFLALTSG
jgi:hypothetical protein